MFGKFRKGTRETSRECTEERSSKGTFGVSRTRRARKRVRESEARSRTRP